MEITMKNRKRIYNRICAAACLLGLMVQMTGCAYGQRETVHKTPVEISCAWWGNDDRHQYTLEGLDRFMALNQDKILVNSQYGSWGGYENRMHIFMKSRNTPDVMLINYAWIHQYSADGNGFYNLYNVSDQIDLQNFTEQELAFGKVDGKLNAIPITFNALTFYYNKTILDRYHLSVPKTWEDLFAAARVLRKDGIYVLGTMEKQLFLLFTAYYSQTTGKEMVDAQGNLSLTKKEIRYIMDFYNRLVSEKVLMPLEKFDRNAFSTGKTAAALGWVSDAGNYCEPTEQAGYKTMIGDYICAKKAKKFGWYVKPATMYAISPITEHPKEAAKLLNYLLNDKDMAVLQGTEKGIPISNSARAVLDEKGVMSSYEKEADDMRESYKKKLAVLPSVLENDTVYHTFKINADYYIYGKKSEAKVIDQIYHAWKEENKTV